MPDFFDEDYHERAGAALKRVDGMALSNLLAGRVFNLMFRDVFADDLADRSKDLVEEVRGYMQMVLRKLFERECAQYPALLKEIDTTLMDEFMDSKESKAMETISNIIKAELGWVFTQDSLYSETVSSVQKMVDSVRTGLIKAKAVAAHDAQYECDNASPAQALGKVPIEFMRRITSCDSNCDEFTICSLQVSEASRLPLLTLFRVLYLWLCGGSCYDVTVELIDVLRASVYCKHPQQLNIDDGRSHSQLVSPPCFVAQVTLFAYTDVACRHLFDAIPKQVHLFLVDSICDEFMVWMLERATPRDLDMWLAEDNQSRRTRVETKRALGQFQKGMSILKAARVRGPFEDDATYREPMGRSQKGKRCKLGDEAWA